MDEELQAVHACREIVRSFVGGVVDYAEFRARMAVAMEPLDPLDWAIKKLDADTGKEAAMYVDWLGGEFGESEERIPRRPQWKYGECDEPYGWVDQVEYRNRLRRAFSAILKKDS